ncbi:MAG: hypothetical protein HQK58_17565 [Deltaproteobacteria bacterium]|nr:hypothetical protein [Deltaproteobacteria bacterium]
MTDSIVYNVSVEMIEKYRGRNLIVRSHDPSDLVKKLHEKDLNRLSNVQIHALGVGIDDLSGWEYAVPIDLVVLNPVTDLPLLYQYAPLLANHAIRVSVPVVPGFLNLAKLAISLDFSVKLEVLQPARTLVDEMIQLAHYYLHQSTVSKPIEYFHSMFLAFYHNTPITIWTIQEEDPTRVRYITDQGEEALSKRFTEMGSTPDRVAFIKESIETPAAFLEECGTCEFRANCSGYFKWPRKDYSCTGAKAVFHMLKDAALELRKDLAQLGERGENRS